MNKIKLGGLMALILVFSVTMIYFNIPMNIDPIPNIVPYVNTSDIAPTKDIRVPTSAVIVFSPPPSSPSLISGTSDIKRLRVDSGKGVITVIGMSGQEISIGLFYWSLIQTKFNNLADTLVLYIWN